MGYFYEYVYEIRAEATLGGGEHINTLAEMIYMNKKELMNKIKTQPNDGRLAEELGLR